METSFSLPSLMILPPQGGMQRSGNASLNGNERADYFLRINSEHDVELIIPILLGTTFQPILSIPALYQT